MGNLVEIIVRAKDDTKAGFAAAGASSDGLNAKLQKIGMIGGAALGAVAVASVVMAAKFDSAMEQIHTQAGVAQNQIAGLKSGVLDLAGKVGFSPDSLAEALYHIESSFASVGIKGPQAMNMLKIAAEGAAVGHANLVDVTNALDAAIASGIPGVHNMSGAMGVLNATVGAGDMKMQDLADAFGTGMLAVVKGFGLSITDVGAALATFGDNNIRGAQAGTELRMAVMALASPAKAGIKVLEGLGLTASQLGKDMQTGGLMKAVTDLKTHMDNAGLSAVQQGQVITEIFGKKAGTGVNILISQFDRLKSKYPDLAKGAKGFGDAWASTQATMAQQWKELESSIQALAIGIGEKLMPYAQKLLSFLSGHKAAVTDFAVGIAAVTVALAGFALVVKTIELVSMLANPIGLVVLAAAALALGFTYLWKKSALFRDIIKDIGKVAVEMGIIWLEVNRDIVVGFLDMVGTVIHAAALAFGWIPGIGGKLRSADKAFSGFKDGVSNSFNSMIGTLQQWEQGLNHNATTTASITAQMQADFANQKKAAEDAKTGITNLTLAILLNGQNSDQAKAARNQLITDLTKAGVNATTATTDVNRYSTAVATNGANSSQAAAARKQLINDILAASKNAAQGQKDLANYTSAVKNNGSTSDAAKTARAKLITDLENAGLNAKQARTLVDGLGTSIGGLKGKTVPIKVDANGYVNVNGYQISAGAYFSPHAAGGIITDGMPYDGNQGDDVLISAKRGEAIVPVSKVPRLAPALKAAGIPGFASGGVVGDLAGHGNFPQQATDAITGFAVTSTEQIASAATKAFAKYVAEQKAAQDAAKAAASSGGGSIPGGGAAAAGTSAAAAQAWMKGHLNLWGWGQDQWSPLLALWNHESGWRWNAQNPASPAYGIPQADPGSKMAAAGADWRTNPVTQMRWGGSYIKGSYGNPAHAWAFEMSHTPNWYAGGGATSSGWAAVGEHGRELIKVPGGSTVVPHGQAEQMLTGGAGGPTLVQLEISSGGQSDFEKFMLKWLREQVRVKGGGSVQKAFGTGSN